MDPIWRAYFSDGVGSTTNQLEHFASSVFSFWAKVFELWKSGNTFDSEIRPWSSERFLKAKIRRFQIEKGR